MIISAALLSSHCRQQDHSAQTAEECVMQDERRKNRRYRISGLESEITDGTTAYPVHIEDISKKGVGLSGVPADFDETVARCFAEIKSQRGDFKLELQPRWVHWDKKGKRKKIGFQIQEPTAEWLEFIEEIKKAGVRECKRSTQRFRTLGLMAMVSDGSSRCFGIVEDISEHGLRLTQIPDDFDDAAPTCSAVVHSPAGDVNISLRPCWIHTTLKGMYKTIGFEIHDPPADWQELIGSLKKKEGQLDFLLPEDEENAPE